ncbi:hypothetical protein KUTeg_005168 [Tegillarca granosa]|uniref:Uncharacterized protein n=1 Tax=Tegillarca granosa TaxID=220873 RepID=A0ABQ9FJ17_TEGGR|nr:hypothetical protein KUTeg_005168 [Tegillarca granosa]
MIFSTHDNLVHLAAAAETFYCDAVKIHLHSVCNCWWRYVPIGHWSTPFYRIKLKRLCAFFPTFIWINAAVTVFPNVTIKGSSVCEEKCNRLVCRFNTATMMRSTDL